MRHAKIALRNDDPLPSLNGLRSRLIKDMSTSTTDNPSGSPLSTGAIIGIVIGSILGAVVLIGVVFLVRHFFCRFPGGLQNVTDKFSVSYTRSDLNASTLERNASSSVNPPPSGGVAPLGRRGGGAETVPSFPTPSFQGNGNAQDTLDGSDTYHEIQTNSPDDSEFSNQKRATDYNSLPSKSSKTGTDNPCFDAEDDKPSPLSITPTKLSIPSISVSRPNSNNSSPSSSALRINTSYAQQRSDMIRRSYHLDRNVASAIAAQRNRETMAATSIFNGSELTPNDDVIIVFTARTVL